jgi:hypothetical protein
MPRRKINSRGYSQRKVDTREVRQRFLIVCEGEKTEPNYFRSFRVPKNVAEIDVQGLGENPSKLVQSAKELKEQEDYDQVWCVFDRDSWTVEDFNNAIKNANAQGFKVAYSNEAFELWYVLHFEFLNTGIPRSDYRQKLTSLLGREYQKNSEPYMMSYLRSNLLLLDMLKICLNNTILTFQSETIHPQQCIC